MLGARPRPYPTPFDAIRKSACSFGWDWGIATATSGIWRPVRLESWTTARLDEVLVRAIAGGDGGVVEVDGARASERMPRPTPTEPRRSRSPAPRRRGDPGRRERGRRALELDDVEPLVARRLRRPVLYDVRVRLGADGRVLDETDPPGRLPRPAVEHGARRRRHAVPARRERPAGLREGRELDPRRRVPGASRPCAGTAPDSQQARAAGLNLIRVWGGGIYEDDAFYELCDELGLLTWQDFLFACAAYSEEEPLRSEVAAEARENIVRLAHHASLCLLTGNNENLWGYEDWGWKLRLDGRTWGAYYYHELFPSLIDELAPHVPYAPGSPFSPGGEHPNDEHHGTMHVWDLWNQKDWPHYRDHAPRFVAEFGWQGPPAWSTLTRAINDDPLTPESPGMIVHQKAVDGNVKLTDGLVRHYRVPGDMETGTGPCSSTRPTRSRARSTTTARTRRRTAGAVVWQLNDCWPVTSWAAIDGDGREKPLFHAIRNAFAPRVVTIQPRGDGLAAVVGNDTGDEWQGRLDFELRGFDGSVRRRAFAAVTVAPRSSETVPVPAELAEATDAANEVLVAGLTGVRGLWFFAEPRDSVLAAPQLDVEVAAEGDGFAVTVTAKGGMLVRDLTLLIDKVDPAASVDSGLVTLLPGETWTFRVRGVDALDADGGARPSGAAQREPARHVVSPGDAALHHSRVDSV